MTPSANALGVTVSVTSRLGITVVCLLLPCQPITYIVISWRYEVGNQPTGKTLKSIGKNRLLTPSANALGVTVSVTSRLGITVVCLLLPCQPITYIVISWRYEVGNQPTGKTLKSIGKNRLLTPSANALGVTVSVTSRLGITVVCLLLPCQPITYIVISWRYEVGNQPTGKTLKSIGKNRLLTPSANALGVTVSVTSRLGITVVCLLLPCQPITYIVISWQYEVGNQPTREINKTTNL